MRYHLVGRGLLLLLAVALPVLGWSADRYWVAAKAGNWSSAANWAAASGGAGGVGMPGAADRAIFDGGGAGDSLIDVEYPGVVGTVAVKAGYAGAITQARDLLVNGDLELGGGGEIGWTFRKATVAKEEDENKKRGDLNVLDPEQHLDEEINVNEDAPAALTVKGTLTIAVGKTLVCPRSVTAGQGAGRTITVGKDLVVQGTLSADGQGLQSGPGTPHQPPPTPDRPIALGGAGYGGRGGSCGDFLGGHTYGSITTPTSLGSGAPRVDLKSITAGRFVDETRELWCGNPTAGGGAITLTVTGATLLSGRISAEGIAGDAGASGGSIYLTTGTLSGSGIISADGSEGLSLGWGRGAGGGGRIAVVLNKGAGVDAVKLHCYGGIGRFSPPAAAGTIYLQLAGQLPNQGKLIVDNNNQAVPNMLDTCTALNDLDTIDASFGALVVRNHGVLLVGVDDKLTAKALSGEVGDVLHYGGYAGPTTGARIETPEGDKRPTVLALGDAPTLKEEQLAGYFKLAYYPYLNKLTVSGNLAKYPRLDEVKTVKSAAVRVVGADGKLLGKGALPLAGGAGTLTLTLPSLVDGTYQVQVMLDSGLQATLPLKRRHFVWEHNTLGITDKIYPPFEPLSVKGDEVSPSQRVYRMNGFGLFDAVIAKGRDLLARPMMLKLETAGGLQQWTFGARKFTEVKPNAATYQAEANSGPLAVKTRSTIEFDGCMKVEMELLPGAKPGEISRLWLEIPLKDAEVPFFHNAAFEGMRRDYSGATPRGGKIVWGPREGAWVPPKWEVEKGSEGKDAVIWTAADTRPWSHPAVNDFVPYIWLGAAERGLCWFAANDKGWLPDNHKPAQVISREDGLVVLRIYLINTPTTLAEPRHLVFGLQASPTRPMLANWRTADYMHMAWGAMSPLGARFCSDKYPLNNDFSIVDHILSQRGKEKRDFSFLEQKVQTLVKNRAWPAAYTPETWLKRWTTGAFGTNDNYLNTNYFEEHYTNEQHEEVPYFRDEWFGGGETYCPSHLDFCAYYANEYLKRGISLYFDNMMPKTSFNTVMNDAYQTADGKVQPACTLWEQREYYKRVWNIYNQYKEQYASAKAPYTFVMHMTNELVLPLCTWAVATLDNEWSWLDYASGRSPAIFPPEVLLTEMTGRQTGTQGQALFPIGAFDLRPNAKPWNKNDPVPPFLADREWGMRAVHEIFRGDFSGMKERYLRGLGYATPEVHVVNYWDDNPPFTVSNPQVKWLGLLRPGQPMGALVLQNYSADAATTTVGLASAKFAMDGVTHEVIPLDAKGAAQVAVAKNYANRILLFAADKAALPGIAAPDTVMADPLDFGLNPLWQYPPATFTIVPDGANRVLRMSKPGAGPAPALSLEKTLLPDATSYEVTLRFRLPKLPETPNDARAGLFQVVYGTSSIGDQAEGDAKFLPGDPEEGMDSGIETKGPAKNVTYAIYCDVDTSRSTLSWALDMAQGAFWKTAVNKVTGHKSGDNAPKFTDLGVPTTGWHTLTLRVTDRHHTLSIDNHVFLDGDCDTNITPALRLSYGNPSRAAYVDFDDIALRVLPNM